MEYHFYESSLAVLTQDFISTLYHKQHIYYYEDEVETKVCIYIYIYISKVDDRSRGRPEGFSFNSYYTEV